MNSADQFPSWALAVFTKAPRLGEVKTRLIPSMGREGALRAHKQLVKSALKKVANTEMRNAAVLRKSLWLSDEHEVGAQWAARIDGELHIQVGDGLGARMLFCLGSEVQQGAQRVCLMGTDCPPINKKYIVGAFSALEKHPIVLAPASDGGYGLIGVRNDAVDVIAPLFQGISWSTDQVVAQTLKAARAEKLDVGLLGEVWDVDTYEDWQRYLQAP